MDSKPSNPKDVVGSGKLPLELVPDTLIVEAAMAFLEGALKYGRFNWRIAGVRASVYRAALLRHFAKWWNGEDCDQETGVNHLASVIACAGIILDAGLCGKLTDDRPPQAPLSKRIDELAHDVHRLKKLFAGHNPKQYTITDSEPMAAIKMPLPLGDGTCNPEEAGQDWLKVFDAAGHCVGYVDPATGTYSRLA